jgi:hypothetical protein
MPAEKMDAEVAAQQPFDVQRVDEFGPEGRRHQERATDAGDGGHERIVAHRRVHAWRLGTRHSGRRTVHVNVAAAPLSGQLSAFFLFDVAEAADLEAVRTLLGGAGESRRFAARTPVPAYAQYAQPPVQVDAEAFGGSPVEGWTARLRIYDYGIVSLALSQPFDGTWAEFLALSQTVMSGAPLGAAAEAYCRAAATRLRPALQEPRETFLSEDYFVSASPAPRARRPPTRCWRPTETTSRGCCGVRPSR